MKFHPYSEVFPFLEGAALDELAADIKANGLREPIWLYQGKILDGRNRFIACERAEVKPEYRQYKGSDPLAFVVSVNIHRRHLTESQRAMAAAEIKAISKSANLHSGDRAANAAEAVSVSRRSVFHADKVLESGSEKLKKAVKAGELSVSKAASVVDLPKGQQFTAATAKATKLTLEDEPLDGREPDEDELKKAEAMEKEYAASMDRIMAADDKLAAAHAEIKRQAAEIAALKIARDGFMNGKTELSRLLKKEQARNERLTRENKKLKGEASEPTSIYQ